MDEKEIAERTLAHGVRFPYDADAPRRQGLVIDWAHAAALGVLADLLDRRGVKWELEKVDPETRVEIVRSLAAIIRLAVSARASEPHNPIPDDEPTRRA